MNIPAACQPLQNQREALMKQMVDVDAVLIQGPHSPHPGKPEPAELAEKKGLMKQLAVVDGKLSSCMLAHGGKPDLNSIFTGLATLTIADSNPQIKGPFHLSAKLGLFFPAWDHSTLTVINFPAIVVGPFSVPTGTDKITVTMNGSASGAFNPTTGKLNLTLALHFHHSFWAAGDSDITFKLSSGNPGGSAVNAAGHVALAGTSTFQGGYLGGDKATIVVSGNLSPRP